MFTPHKPLEKHPEIFYGYSNAQRSKRYYRNGKKCFAVQNLVAGSWKPGAGPDPWPLYFENEALAVLGSPESDGVVWEFEGEKCCALAVQGGLLAVSQPGHAHKPKQRAPRYHRCKGSVESTFYKWSKKWGCSLSTPAFNASPPFTEKEAIRE